MPTMNVSEYASLQEFQTFDTYVEQPIFSYKIQAIKISN